MRTMTKAQRRIIEECGTPEEHLKEDIATMHKLRETAHQMSKREDLSTNDRKALAACHRRIDEAQQWAYKKLGFIQ